MNATQTIGGSNFVVWGEIKSELLTKAVEMLADDSLRRALVGKFMWLTREEGDALASEPVWFFGNAGVGNPLWTDPPAIGEGI